MSKHITSFTDHDSRAGAQLAAVVVRDGTLDRVDAWTPLDELMAKEKGEPGSDDEILEMTRGEFDDAVYAARLAAMTAFLRYVWFGSRNLWEAIKRLLAITRKIRPEFIKGMSATQVAWMLSETKAATSAREIRVVESYLISWGVIGYMGAGGAKSKTARGKYAEVQQGNTNRKNGKSKAA